MMTEFFKSVFEWQRARSKSFRLPNSLCQVCGTMVLPGEAHFGCNKVTSKTLKAEWQCIICAQDEREGSHADCYAQLENFRKGFFDTKV